MGEIMGITKKSDKEAWRKNKLGYLDADWKGNILLSDDLNFNPHAHRNMLYNNILVCGGGGSGKGYRYVAPNILQCHGNMVVVDFGNYYLDMTREKLTQNGYTIHCIGNSAGSGRKMDGFSPFKYMTKRTYEDMSLHITDAIVGAFFGDSYFHYERILLGIYILYTYMYAEEKTLYTVYSLIKETHASPYGILTAHADTPEGINLMTMYEAFENILDGEEDTVRYPIRDNITKMTEIFGKEEYRQLFGKDTVKLNNLNEKDKQILFINLPQMCIDCDIIVSLIVHTLYELRFNKGGTFDEKVLPRIHYFLDMSRSGYIESLDNMIAGNRGHNTIFSLIVHFMNDLDKYKQTEKKVILEHTTKKLFMGTHNANDIEWWANHIGSDIEYLKNLSNDKCIVCDHTSATKANDVFEDDKIDPNKKYEFEELPSKTVE